MIVDFFVYRSSNIQHNQFFSSATVAASDGVKVFKFKSWRKKGVALPEVLDQYMSIDPELNVMPFCSQFIPMEVGLE